MGGERLYYTRIYGLVLFASTVKPLLAHSRVGFGLDPGALGEAVLTGLTVSSGKTLFAGINEVPPGCRLTFETGRAYQQPHWPGLLKSKKGSLSTLASGFRDALGEAVGLAIGRRTRIAVTLSGGIDSAAITALAAEALGADNIDAFTYEFDDPTHRSETSYAREVCQRLGIRRHHVFKISLAEFLSAIPETVWRSEHIAHWPKAWMIPVSRRIREAGFDRYLSGFGIGSHMAYLEDLVALLGWLPCSKTSLKVWKLARTRQLRWLGGLEHLHPGFALPNFRQYYLLLCLLRHYGVVENVSEFYPRQMRALVTDALAPVSCEHCDGTPLIDVLRQHSFDVLASCVDVTRWEKVLREIGTERISPAHFASCMPYAYMPVKPHLPIWSAKRKLRPGKLLLRIAMRRDLPESVLYRKKSWADAVISPRWHRAGLKWMRQVIPATDHYLGKTDPRYLSALKFWSPRSPQDSVTALAFWHRVFSHPGNSEPPTWEELHQFEDQELA